MAARDDAGISAEATPGATPTGEFDLLAEIYMFILQCGEERRVAGAYGGDGARKEESNASGEISES
jgi:hypothetical protein